jgi:Spy/CpxP family protein refolding chaperone
MDEKFPATKLLLSAILLTAAAFVPAACFAAANSSPMPEMRWRMIGPFRGGRTRAAAGVPDQPNVFYMGQADGGV